MGETTERDRTRFRSATGWLTWSIIAGVVAMDVTMLWLDAGWVMVLLVLLTTFVCLMPLYNVYYKIDGRELVVHYLFQSIRFPIDKISEVRAARSCLAAPALSLDRLAIKFSDRKVLRSSAPMYISPVRRHEFIDRLLEINPSIHIVP